MSSCQVAIFDAANRPLRIESIETPVPKSNELLVKIDACSVCGSDLHTMTGARAEKTPTILGHEIVGTVVESGDNQHFDANHSPLKTGDRITWSVCLSCGNCDRCDRGFPQKCEQLKKIGHEKFASNADLLGGFAEYILLPSTSTIFKIAADTPTDVICPANCATATTLAAFRVAGQVKDRSILVIGAGLLGLTAAAFAKTENAKTILMIEPDALRREIASDFGVTKALPSLDELEEGQKFDVIMDYSGAASAIEHAISFAALGCQIVLVGSVLPSPSIQFDPEFLVRNLVALHGVHNYKPIDLKNAIQFLEQYGDSFPFGSLVEKSFPLTKINEAIDYAVKHKPIRVMIRP